MKYPAYPRYKDSGVEWLGAVPEHWETKPLFSLMSERTERNIGNKENNVLSLSYGNVIRRDVENNVGLLPESFETYQIVEPPNIIMRLTDLQNDQRSLRVGQVKERGIITSAYVCLNVGSDIEAAFAYYLLHGYDLLKVYYALGGGLRQTMRFDDLKRLPLLYPTLEEQRQIVNFLDRETSKIDLLIAKQGLLIELLQEKRQSITSHAVTKGLNPNALMKDSGVGWLGEIPAHWTIKRLKFISPRLGVGLVINPSTYVTDSGVPFLFGGNVSEGKVHLENVRFMSESSSLSLPMSRLETGDLVTVRVGYPGITAVISQELSGANCASMMVIKAGKFNSQWLCYCMNSKVGKDQVELVQYGAAQKQFNISDAVDFSFPTPSEDEQRAIVNFLDREIMKLDRLLNKAQLGVQLLKEHRTALISAAVTGKIDVRQNVNGNLSNH